MKRKELVEKSAVLPLLFLLLLSAASPLLNPFFSPPVQLANAAPTEQEYVAQLYKWLEKYANELSALNQRFLLEGLPDPGYALSLVKPQRGGRGGGVVLSNLLKTKASDTEKQLAKQIIDEPYQQGFLSNTDYEQALGHLFSDTRVYDLLIERAACPNEDYGLVRLGRAGLEVKG